MKALTICQPYAELIARGEKRIVNRAWPTSYRGPLAIHAGKSRAWLSADGWRITAWTRRRSGAVIAVAQLIDCVKFEQLLVDLQRHEHAQGPWCWVLSDVRRIEPMRCSGALGLWDCEVNLVQDRPDE